MSDYIRNPFMPRGYLETNNSLNRLILGDTPDSPNSVSLLSSDVLTDTIESYKGEVNIPEALHRSRYGRFVSDVASGETSPAQGRARLILEDWADKALLFFDVLLEGRDIHRKLRGEWSDECWNWWKSRRTIVVGGGLTQGYAGERLKLKLGSFLARSGRTLIMPPGSGDLPLIGAVLAVPSVRNGYILGMDYGHTGVKRALFEVRDGFVSGFKRMPSLVVERDFHMAGFDFSIDPSFLKDFFYGSLTRSLEEGAEQVSIGGVGISVANYIQNGRVVPRGMYGHLAEEGKDGDNIAIPLKEILSERKINPRCLSLLHDGTAAANCFYGKDRAAVILFGSAIGGGFPYMKPPLSWNPDSFAAS